MHLYRSSLPCCSHFLLKPLEVNLKSHKSSQGGSPCKRSTSVRPEVSTKLLQNWTMLLLLPVRPRTENNMQACLRFIKLHLNKSQDLWNNVRCTDETKEESFGLKAQHQVGRKPNIAF